MFSVMDDIWFEDESGMSVDIVKGTTVVRANPAGNRKKVSELLFENTQLPQKTQHIYKISANCLQTML